MSPHPYRSEESENVPIVIKCRALDIVRELAPLWLFRLSTAMIAYGLFSSMHSCREGGPPIKFDEPIWQYDRGVMITTATVLIAIWSFIALAPWKPKERS